MRRPAVLACAIALVLAGSTAGCGDDDDDGAGGLPEVDGTAAPEAFRVVYEVVTPDSSGEEERIVHRPFDAHVIERDAEGEVTAERWSTLGQLVTRSQGGEAVRIDTAMAPAATDVRPDRFSDRLLEAEKVVAAEDGLVGGRPCSRLKDTGAVLTAPAAESQDPGGSLPVLVERCVDPQGLVLEERWTTAGGQRVLTKRAVELELGDDVPEIDVPDADPLPLEQGNGAVQEVDADAPPPFLEQWSLPAPDGFTFVGRFAVQPARLSQATLTSDTDVALYTDVWERAGDLLLLDQGASRSGALPFDPRSSLGPIDVPGIGPAELAVDLRVRGGPADPTRRRVRAAGRDRPPRRAARARRHPPALGGDAVNRPAVVTHLRRYPWWYGLAAVWLVGMLALPVVRLDPLGVLSGDGGAAPVAGGPAPDGNPAGGVPTIPPGLLEDVDRSLFDLTTTTVPGDATSSTAPEELELVPPEVLDLLLEALPPIVFPPLPEELSTLAAGIAPIAAFGCSGLGLAGLVVSVVSQTVEGVPLGRLLPYLTPVSAACAAFPVPPVHTVCAADEPLVIDLGGVTSTPPIIGLGIDQLEAIETLMESTFGVSVPKLAPQLRDLLTCRVVKE